MDATDILVELGPEPEGWEPLLSGRWPVVDEIAAWSRVLSMQTGPEMYVDELTADLWTRDHIEIALTALDEPVRSRVAAIVARLDSEYRMGTKDDTEGVIAAHFNVPSKADWWWSRIPSGWRSDMR